MQTEELIRLLATHPFFQSWGDDALAHLIRETTLKTFHVGEALWTEGEEGHSAYILVEGRVERTLHVRPEGHRTTHHDRAGELLSLSSLVHPWEHTSTGTPLETVTVLELSRAQFMGMFEADSPTAYRLVDAIAANLVEEMRDANKRLHKVFGQPAETLRMLRRRMRTQ